MGYYQTQAPDGDPLTLAEVKAHLRVDVPDDDLLITALMTAVLQHVNQITARSLLTQKWAYTTDGFYTPESSTLRLEKGPITSIDSINYVDMNGKFVLMPDMDYIADLTGQVARITPRFGKIWPTTLPQIASVTVNFTAGYGTAADVPQGLKSWMKLRIGSLYENREDVLVGARIIVIEMPFVDSLLDAYRIVRA